jgi:hypothetical protein
VLRNASVLAALDNSALLVDDHDWRKMGNEE